MARFAFTVEAQAGAGRAGRLRTPHGEAQTPVFMPCGTQGTVKGVPQETLEELGCELVLANTYHLYLRPGAEAVRKLGGLHAFMAWPRALLTDSGGFQVFSLNELRKVSEEGVRFRSHLDGSEHMLTPEGSIQAQQALGADVMMVFDECTEYPAERSRARASLELSLRWAQRCKSAVNSRQAPGGSRAASSTNRQEAEAGRQALFGIAHGGMYADLRKEAAERLVEMDFDGYAIGGLSVGEPRELTEEMLAATLPLLPKDKPRYVMGVGTPEEIAKYAGMGVDMMDCVLPTRAARHGLLYTSAGKLNIRNAANAGDQRPPDEMCNCPLCRRYSRAYLRHLHMSREPLGAMLGSAHNLAHYLDTMRRVRHSISLEAHGGPPPATAGAVKSQEA